MSSVLERKREIPISKMKVVGVNFSYVGFASYNLYRLVDPSVSIVLSDFCFFLNVRIAYPYINLPFFLLWHPDETPVWGHVVQLNTLDTRHDLACKSDSYRVLAVSHLWVFGEVDG